MKNSGGFAFVRMKVFETVRKEEGRDLSLYTRIRIMKRRVLMMDPGKVHISFNAPDGH